MSVSVRKNVTLAFLGVALLLGQLAAPALAQSGAAITDAERDCIIRVPYPELAASIEPRSEVEAARIYFRAAQSPDFYWVEMTPGATGFTAVIPAPAAETVQVVYYVESIGADFDATTTAEFRADVVDSEIECDGDPAALYDGAPPGIKLYSTVAGAPATPVGFASGGIASTIAGGVATGGGLDPLVIGGIIAVGVIAGVVIIDHNQGDKPAASPTAP